MPTERRRIMLAAAERLEAKREAIAEVMAAEVGASALLRQVAGFTTQVQGSTIPTDKPGRLSMTLRQPVSIVSWNGPILLAARAIAYPLALVDTVLFRASEASPRTHSLVAEALYKAGLRAGAIKFIVNIPEDAADIIDTLITHSAVRRVNFTGSTKVGRIIAEKYAIQLKRCLLELDGKAPFLELHDADLDGAADAAIFGAFLHQGEICMSRFVVAETIADAFLEKFVAKVAALPLGDPAINPGSVSRPLIDARSGTRIAELIEDAFAKGVTLAIGDKGEGAVMPATIVDHVRAGIAIYDEKTFGVNTTIVSVKDTKDAVRVANDALCGRSSAVFRRYVALDVASLINAGCVHIIGATIQNELQAALRRHEAKWLRPLRRQRSDRRVHRTQMRHDRAGRSALPVLIPRRGRSTAAPPFHIRDDTIPMARYARHLPRMLAITVALLASGCASVPHATPGPAMLVPSDLHGGKMLTASAVDWPTDTWWQRYRDPQLDTLVGEAILSSPTLKVAAARVRRAEAITEQTRASDLPQLTLGASFAEAKASYWNGVPFPGVPKGVNDAASVRLGLDWNLDFFGRNRAAIAAALSATDTSRADAAQARLVLTTAVASAYADLLGQMRDVDLATDTVSVRERTADLVRRRRAEGLETLASQGQAQSALESARQALNASNELVDLTRLRLAAMLGAGPDRAETITRPADPALAVFGLPSNVPADLIGRRPDVRAARYRVEVRAAQIKQARAGFYPSINLSAFIGPQVLGLGQFFNAQSIAGNIGPAISLPLFRGSALSANYRGSRADYDEAVASYNEALIHALQDVAQVTTSTRALTEQLGHARAAQDAASTAYHAATLRYRGGLLSYIAVLSAENTLISARRAVSQLETRRFALDVALVRALGGGA